MTIRKSIGAFASSRAEQRASFACAVLLGPLLLVACGTPSGSGAVGPSRLEATNQSPIDPTFEAAFESLRQALADDDTAVARRVLSGILARRPEGETLATAERYVAVVDGRAVMEAVRFEIVLEADPANKGSTRATLHVSSDLRVDAKLEIAPMVVTRSITALDRRGVEVTRTSSLIWEEASGLVLPANGGVRATTIGSLALPQGEIVAVRESWHASARAGYVHFEGQLLPVRAFDVVSPPKEWLAGFLSRGALGTDALAEFLAEEGTFALDAEVFTARLLERVLRVPLDRRAELIDVFVAAAPRLRALDRVKLQPAIRWLLDSVDPEIADEWRERLTALDEPFRESGSTGQAPRDGDGR